MVERRCAIMKDVRPLSMASSPFCSARSVFTSILDVASSRIRMDGSESSVLAKDISYRCPSLRVEPRSFTSVR